LLEEIRDDGCHGIAQRIMITELRFHPTDPGRMFRDSTENLERREAQRI
jgi:hypothetical protein